MKFIFFFVIFFSIHHSYSYDFQKDIIISTNIDSTFINKDSEIILDDNWEFYWGKLIEPNNFKEKKATAIIKLTSWQNFEFSKKKLPSFGYATYRLIFKIPEERPSMSLYIPKIFSASKLWINGELISEIGHVSTSKKNTLHRRFSRIVPLKTDEDTFEIVIQVANFYHYKGGISQPLKLATSQHLQTAKYKKIMADMFFIGCLGFMGIFFLLFYYLYWNKDKSVRFFAILCVSLSYMALSDRYMPLTYIFESISWIFLTKIEYISLFLAGTSASLFFNDIFISFVHKLYSKIILVIFSILSLLVIFIPAPFFTKIISIFFFLMTINLLYVIYVIIRAIINKREESILLLVSMFLGSIIFSVHLFFFLEENEDVIIYINFGYILAFLSLSMLLMTRFSNSFKELEISKNIALQQKKEISIKSQELSEVNLKLEENLKLLENYNTELDSFNHIVSHDLKSPLISIYSLATFIEEDLKTSLNENTKSHLTLLKDVVSKMEALINGLLEYSKVAKGDKKKELFSLNQLLKKVISIVDYQNKSTIIIPKNDVEIYANKLELDHVFQNLISNSIKHNNKEKAIITIEAFKQLDEYIFSVSDNGPGINPKYHDKIFNIFSQLKTSKEVESTGIGLAIVKKIVSQNHGIITVSSEKEKGLNIVFTWKL